MPVLRDRPLPRDPWEGPGRQPPDGEPQHSPMRDPEPPPDSEVPVREPDQAPVQSALLLHGFEFGNP